jgi:hypothetical protein
MESPIWNMWNATSAPSQSAQRNYQQAGKLFEDFLSELKAFEKDLSGIEQQLNDLGGPYTKGRVQIPDWKME